MIKIEAMVFSWPGHVQPVLDIEHWQIERGERVFVYGPSGCGKSTLLALLAGVQLPGQGDIRVLDTSLAKLRGAQRDQYRADHIGFIFQQFNLIPYLSALDNVLLPVRFSARRRAQLTSDSSPAERNGDAMSEARRLLRALDLPAETDNQPARLLSVGQQQRVAAARALIGRPEIIIADEPTSALDAERQQAFLNLLATEAEAAGSTLIFVSHDQRLAPAFSRVVDLRTINRAGAG